MVTRNLIGERFSRLLVIERAGSDKSGARWRCRCDCGEETTAARGNLVDGKVKSCGCLGRESGLVHGMTTTRTYNSWATMRQRCSNPKVPGAHNYIGRGITICERWNSFSNFLADMGERPPGTTLDRTDNDKGYEPGNCRWATPSEQTRNMRTTRLTADQVQEIHGRCEHGESQSAVARRFGMRSSSVHNIRTGRAWRDQIAGPTVTSSGGAQPGSGR